MNIMKNFSLNGYFFFMFDLITIQRPYAAYTSRNNSVRCWHGGVMNSYQNW